EAVLIQFAELPLHLLGVALVEVGPDRMDDMTGGQVAGRGGARLSGGAAPAVLVGGQLEAGLLQCGAGGAVNRPIDASAAFPFGVGGIDNRIDLLLDDVAQDEFDPSLSDRPGDRNAD